MNRGTMQMRSCPAIEPKYYKLPGVKECLYHPRLPTFRRMDIDTAAHKLPDVHCRTTTPCSTGKYQREREVKNITHTPASSPSFFEDNFNKGTVALFFKPSSLNDNPSCNRYWRYQNLYRSHTDATKKEQDEENDNSSTENVHDNELVKSVKSSYNPPITRLSVTKQRSARPWRFVLQQEPYIDHIGQRPIPATTFSRYRSTSSSYGGQVSANGWRP